jgi:septal ring factor EnvC (AmiA/AmiB activator)
MKRISFLLVTLALCGAPAVRAQDAATEERLNQLRGSIEDMRASDEALRSRLDAVTKEVASLREKVGQPTGNYASAEDVKSLANAIKEIDRKRIEDNEKIKAELQKLAKLLSAPVPSSTKKGTSSTSTADPTSASDSNAKGYEYVIQEGDTLSKIAGEYKKKNIKIVSVSEIVKANPGLNPNNMVVGKKIFIPALAGP